MALERDVAAAAMLIESAVNSRRTFLAERNLQLPPPNIPGALPVMGLGWSPAGELHRLLDLVTLWGIGDFDEQHACSRYYDPNSPWYNVMYGAYAIRSYKRDGTAWGYDGAGKANFEEFLEEVVGVDYNFTTAGAFGCPPSKMCFTVKDNDLKTTRQGVWDVADLTATVPSGLHDPTKFSADPSSYLVFGIPNPALLQGRDSFEPVEMQGRFYMQRLVPPPGVPPITLVWGTACPKNNRDGNALLELIMTQLGNAYLRVGG